MPQRVGLFPRQETPRKLRESFCRVPLQEMSATRKKPQVEARVERTPRSSCRRSCDGATRRSRRGGQDKTAASAWP